MRRLPLGAHELGGNMARIDVPDGPGKESSRMFAMAPHLAKGLGAMSKAVYEQASIPIREREAMRMRIAQLNQCDI